VGVINISDQESIHVDDERDYIEVRPHFDKLTPVEEGYPDGRMYAGKRKIIVDILVPPSRPFEKLNNMVGCKDIKQRLEEFKSLAEYNKACLRQSWEYPVMHIFLHSVFYGNPGTGKTTVCRLYGALLKEAGLLSKGHVVVADRNIFCGDCFGDTEAMIPELIEMSKGGILMFDEAYLLEGVHSEDPNKMVLPLLLSALADEKNKDFAVVLCGYKDKLDKMIEQNPGLYSRFVNRFEFKDYTLDELTEIGIRYLKSFGHTFSLDGLAAFREELSKAMASRTKTWANARSVKSMIENCYVKRAMRYGKGGTLDREITAEDICSIPYERRNKIGFNL
jgi:SpoVK/Ycf46/Vps4 family AAA+-type ATPase